VLPDVRFHLQTDRGTFSPDRIDPGTKLLLLDDPLAERIAAGPLADERPDRTGAVPGEPPTLVDLGCGYGPIALTLALRHPSATVWAVDVNERALELCRSNAEALGLTNVVVGQEDELPPTQGVSAIYSNPPIRVGKEALHELLVRWGGRLATGAPLLLVVRRDLGAESLERWLAGRGWAPSRLAARAGYRVLQAVPAGVAP
jgi:16S rRNA (guanine1207-N2)-methyltransferase